MSPPQPRPAAHATRSHITLGTSPPPSERSSDALTVDPRTDAAWQDLVRARGTSVFQSSEWIRAIASTYGFDVKARILMDNSGPAAGLPYTTVNSMDGPRVVSFPFSDYSDPIVSSQDDWHTLSSSLLDAGLPMTIRCLRNQIPLTDNRFVVVNKARWHTIDLRLDVNDQWQHLEPSARRAIRRSRQAQVDISHARATEELRAFYDLHLRLRKAKYRLLAQPYAFFENLWREFVEAEKGTLLLARVEGKIVAGVLFLESKDTLFYKFNASSPAFSACRPNDALLWAGIEYGQERGLRSMDLGLSGWEQEGLVRYKRKYASEEKTISFLSHLPDGTLPTTELALLMPRLTHLLTDERVPDETTEQAGATLYPYFA